MSKNMLIKKNNENDLNYQFKFRKVVTGNNSAFSMISLAIAKHAANYIIKKDSNNE
jgi:hypothetical protein